MRSRAASRRVRPRPLSREFAALAYGSRRSNSPVPLKHAGVRMGLHAKSLVVDEDVGVVVAAYVGCVHLPLLSFTSRAAVAA